MLHQKEALLLLVYWPYTKISGMILPLRLTFRLPFAALRLTRRTFLTGKNHDPGFQQVRKLTTHHNNRDSRLNDTGPDAMYLLLPLPPSFLDCSLRHGLNPED